MFYCYSQKSSDRLCMLAGDCTSGVARGTVLVGPGYSLAPLFIFEGEYLYQVKQCTRRKHSKIHCDSVIIKDISMHIFANTTLPLVMGE